LDDLKAKRSKTIEPEEFRLGDVSRKAAFLPMTAK
jgi:hypothetical protein